MTASLVFKITLTALWLGCIGFVALNAFPKTGWRRIAFAVLLPLELVLVGLRFAAYAGPDEWILGNEIQLAMMLTFFAMLFVSRPAADEWRKARAARRSNATLPPT